MDKAVSYQRAVAVSAVALVSTFALLPENGNINYNSSIVPILSAVAFVLLEATPSAGDVVDSIARGMALCWWLWVCYSPMWYHHAHVWWSGASVFALSVTVMGYNAAAWCLALAIPGGALASLVLRDNPLGAAGGRALAVGLAARGCTCLAVLHLWPQLGLRCAILGCSGEGGKLPSIES